MTTLQAFSVAVRTGPRPRHTLHVQRNNEPAALCGLGPVQFVGDVDARLLDEAVLEWPFCDRCADLAGPDIMEGWIPSTEPEPTE
jgi:hypothetical protein